MLTSSDKKNLAHAWKHLDKEILENHGDPRGHGNLERICAMLATHMCACIIGFHSAGG